MLKTAIVPFVGVLLALVTISAAYAKPPNVLLLCADDHAPYVMGAYGNKVVRTPNLDALATSGMRFDRAFCNSPVCTASRQSFLTGRYPRTIGVTLLSTPLPESETTLAELLREAGYETAAIGKMHFNSQLKHGFDLRLDNPQYQQALKQRGATPLPEGIAAQPPWKPFKDPARVWLNSAARPLAMVDADMNGTYFAEESASFVRAAREKPFFLICSFTQPHSPFHFPVEYRDRHDPGTFSVLKPGPEDDAQIPEIFRELTDAEKQGINAAYYTSVEFMDKNVGLVLKALEESGHADDTLVIYLGDHGYFLGQHGRFEKHASFEEAIRAPLLVRFPGKVKPGSSTQALVEFIDIVPMVLEVCGVKIPENVQGKSLARLLKGETAKHRDAVFIEYAQNDEACIRTDRWKLIYERGKRKRTDGYDPGRPLPGPTLRLYDLESDPNEMKNLANAPEHEKLVHELTGRLVAHLKQTARQGDQIPKADDPLELLDYLVQPRDVTP